MSNNKTDEIVDDNPSETEQSRRDFLKKAGKFAVYTPPAVMLLMKPSYATLSKSYAGRPPKGGHRPEGNHKPRGHRKPKGHRMSMGGAGSKGKHR